MSYFFVMGRLGVIAWLAVLPRTARRQRRDACTELQYKPPRKGSCFAPVRNGLCVKNWKISIVTSHLYHFLNSVQPSPPCGVSPERRREGNRRGGSERYGAHAGYNIGRPAGASVSPGRETDCV